MTRLSTQLLNRGAIRIGGEDRRMFLQGLISNDIELCTPGQPIYAALLTPQGKFLHDLFIIDMGEAFLADCESGRADDLLKRLAMYKLRAQVTLEKTGHEVWAVCNDGSTLAMPGEDTVFIDPRLSVLGRRAIVNNGASLGDAQQVDFAVYDKNRISLGIPDGSRDMIVGKSTLLECNLDRFNAISWTKGCYVGQELTARMHHRGLVKKRLFTVKINGAPPPPGTVIRLNGEDVGEMRSHCEDVGLALLNIEKTVTMTGLCVKSDGSLFGQ